MVEKYAGADWIERTFGIVDMSPLGKAAADFFGDVFKGIYHLPYKQLKKVNWRDECVISINLSAEIATVDNGVMTRIVVLAHDRMLRVSINALTPQFLRWAITQRKARGEACPYLDDHVGTIRAEIGLEEPL